MLLVYDTTNYVSFTHVTNWLTDARAQIEPYQSVFLLVGTKIDRESERQVSDRHPWSVCFSIWSIGDEWRRQSFRWLSQYFIYWNLVKIVTLRSRNVHSNRSRNLRSARRWTNSCAKRVRHSHSSRSLKEFRFFRWDGVKPGPNAAIQQNENASVDITQNVSPRKSYCCGGGGGES